MVSGIEAVFLDNRELLLRFIRARGGAEGADDLLQDLWLKVSVGPSEPVSHPLPYLYRMANNLMLDRRRGEMRRAVRERHWMEAEGGAENVGSDVASGERVLAGRDQVRAVEARLCALGERTHDVFRRYRLDGVSQQEIAREMGISLSAVEKHLQKAYRELIQLRREMDAG